MISNIAVEDMSYLVDNFTLKKDPEEKLHPTQTGGKQISMKLLFVVPDAVEFSITGNGVVSPAKEQPILKLVAISVPKGLPIYRIRHLIKYLEGSLKEIYTASKRANFVLIKPEHGDNWELSFELPTYGVVYV